MVQRFGRQSLTHGHHRVMGTPNGGTRNDLAQTRPLHSPTGPEPNPRDW